MNNPEYAKNMFKIMYMFEHIVEPTIQHAYKARLTKVSRRIWAQACKRDYAQAREGRGNYQTFLVTEQNLCEKPRTLQHWQRSGTAQFWLR